MAADPADPSKRTFRDRLWDTYPEVADAFATLRRVVREAGPIPAKDRELIMLGAFVAARMEGGFKVHTRIALAEGATPAEIYHTVLLTLGTAQGLSPVVEALGWAAEVCAET